MADLKKKKRHQPCSSQLDRSKNHSQPINKPIKEGTRTLQSPSTFLRSSSTSLPLKFPNSLTSCLFSPEVSEMVGLGLCWVSVDFTLGLSLTLASLWPLWFFPSKNYERKLTFKAPSTAKMERPWVEKNVLEFIFGCQCWDEMVTWEILQLFGWKVWNKQGCLSRPLVFTIQTSYQMNHLPDLPTRVFVWLAQLKLAAHS